MRAHLAEKTPIILSAPCESRRGERPLLAAHGSVRSARMPSCSHILAQPQGERAAGAVVQVVAAVAAVAMPAVGGKKRHPLAVGKPRAVKAVAVAEVAAVAMVVVAVALVAAVEKDRWWPKRRWQSWRRRWRRWACQAVGGEKWHPLAVGW